MPEELRPEAGSYVTDGARLYEVHGMTREGAYHLEDAATEEVVVVTPEDLTSEHFRSVVPTPKEDPDGA